MEQHELLYKDEVYAIIGAAIEVHKELGNGFLESVYEEALSIEMTSRNIPHQLQVRLPVFYKGIQLQKEFVADYIAYNKIIVELKCISRLTNVEIAQTLNYLKATNLHLGLLINFGQPGKLDWQRLILTPDARKV